MFLVAFFLALRERSGRRQPPAERSPCILIFTRSPYTLLLGLSFIFYFGPIVCECVISCSQSFYSQQPLLLTTSADFVSYFVLNFHRYTTAPSPRLPTPPSAAPPPLLLLVTTAYRGMFLKVKNRLPVVMTSPRQCQSVLCALFLLPDGRCCRHHCCCAARPCWAIARLCARRRRCCCCELPLLVLLTLFCCTDLRRAWIFHKTSCFPH